MILPVLLTLNVILFTLDVILFTLNARLLEGILLVVVRLFVGGGMEACAESTGNYELDRLETIMYIYIMTMVSVTIDTTTPDTHF